MSAEPCRMHSMTDPSVQRAGPTRPPAAITDLALLVRVPGRPEAIRAFTRAESVEADGYAAAVGGSVENLPG
jgi:hypothetical protein